MKPKQQGMRLLSRRPSRIALALRLAILSVLPAASQLYSAGTARAFSDGDGVPRIYHKGRNFRIPFNLNADGRDRIRELHLLVSEDLGYHWKAVSKTYPDHPTFTFRSSHDGEYWFAVQTRTTDGRVSPPPDTTVEPNLKVVVDSFPPSLFLEPGERRGSLASVRWEAKDENIDLKTLILEYQVEGVGVWRRVPIARPKLNGGQRWDAGTAEALKVRASVADKAGNVTDAAVELPDATSSAPESTLMDPPADEPPSIAQLTRGGERRYLGGPGLHTGQPELLARPGIDIPNGSVEQIDPAAVEPGQRLGERGRLRWIGVVTKVQGAVLLWLRRTHLHPTCSRWPVAHPRMADRVPGRRTRDRQTIGQRLAAKIRCAHRAARFWCRARGSSFSTRSMTPGLAVQPAWSSGSHRMADAPGSAAAMTRTGFLPSRLTWAVRGRTAFAWLPDRHPDWAINPPRPAIRRSPGSKWMARRRRCSSSRRKSAPVSTPAKSRSPGGRAIFICPPRRCRSCGVSISPVQPGKSSAKVWTTPVNSYGRFRRQSCKSFI